MTGRIISHASSGFIESSVNSQGQLTQDVVPRIAELPRTRFARQIFSDVSVSTALSYQSIVLPIGFSAVSHGRSGHHAFSLGHCTCGQRSSVSIIPSPSLSSNGSTWITSLLTLVSPVSSRTIYVTL